MLDIVRDVINNKLYIPCITLQQQSTIGTFSINGRTDSEQHKTVETPSNYSSTL